MSGQQALFQPVPNLREGEFRISKGHIASGDLTFVDLGPVLRAWCWGGDLDLTPARAQQVGAALIAWAERREAGHRG